MVNKEEAYQLPPLVPRYISLARAASFIQNPIPILSDNLSKYGSTYRFHIGGLKQGIVTIEPEFIQHVLQKNNRNYRKSEIQTDLLAHYVGKGLLTSEGEYWLRQRRLIQPGFHKERLVKLVDIMNGEISDCMQRLREKSRSGNVIDLYQVMHKLAFRIVAKTLFSTGMTESQISTLSGQITEIQKFIVKEIRQPYARLWHKLSGQKRNCEQLAQETRQILTAIIEQRLSSGEKYDDLLQMLIDTRYEDTGKGMTLTQLLDECLILFVAGHETSANALSWAIFLLSQNQDKLEILRRESDHLSFAEYRPGFDDLKSLTYTSQCIEESLRLYPPAWIIDRVAIDDDKIAGHRIPRNTMIILYIFGSHRNPDIWEDPESFIPERFDVETRKSIPNFAYFPFGGGPRLCIGNNFAMMEMQLVLTRFVQEFDFHLQHIDITLLPLITLRPLEKLEFTIYPRTR
ncbi:MAG: cytochrome P450 [Saprospiraceae bacterium]|nr:cytochrome P450 [Saprospiraceae bacterium]